MPRQAHRSRKPWRRPWRARIAARRRSRIRLNAAPKVDVNWSLARASREQDRYEANGGDPVSRAGPLNQWLALRRLEAHREDFEAGKRMALYSTICSCAINGLPIPRWAAVAFLNGYNHAVSFRVRSWDEALGPPHTKGSHLASARRRRQFAPILHMFAEGLRKDPTRRALDDGFFEEVGERFGIGKTLAKTVYYEREKSIARCNASLREKPLKKK